METKNKRDFVKSLKQVKVVLGNGFDLCCGLHTKYSDFYCEKWAEYTNLRKIYKKYVNSTDDLNINDGALKNINIWDLFFALSGSENPKENMQNWCDVELLIKDSLYQSKEADNINEVIDYLLHSDSPVNWCTTKKIIATKDFRERSAGTFAAILIEEKMKRLNYRINHFYDFLLQELKEFEKRFGDFIYWQLHYGKIEETKFGVINSNATYIEKAKYILNELCDLESSSIDTFNYSFIEDEKIDSKIRHINGDFREPIFGVDTIFSPEKEEYVFTKTSRRMEADMNDSFYLEKEDFKHVVVFGHSLNEADYSYFFPLFDNLDLSHPVNSRGVVVFAYYVWENGDEEQIKISLRKRITQMLYAYSEESGVSNPKRFLDSLSTQGKIILYQIQEFPNSLKYNKSRLDIEWDDIYKKIKEFEDNQKAEAQ